MSAEKCPFESFVTRFQARTGLWLKLNRKRDDYREYWACSNNFELFKIGVRLCESRGPLLGMVSTPDIFELDPESSAKFRNNS